MRLKTTKIMLPAVICFMSVLCTASLSSFGMDAAAIAMHYKKGTATVISSADEDIVRGSSKDDSSCVMFHELFAAVAILVSIAYYAVVKLSLVAMGAVIMTPPNPHPLYRGNEMAGEGSEDYSSSSEKSESTDTFSMSSSNDENEENQEQLEEEKHEQHIPQATGTEAELCMVVVHTGNTSSPQQHHQQQRRRARMEPFPSSDEIHEIEEEEEDEEEQEVVFSATAEHWKGVSRKRRTAVSQEQLQKQKNTEEGSTDTKERFSSLKIWTNVYGLSVGIYCLVYSLLLPNELSAFVFCCASLLAGIHETLMPCIHIYLRDEAEEDEYEMLLLGREDGRKKKKKVKNQQATWTAWVEWRRQAKRCLGWLCLFQNSVASELTEAAARSMRKSRARCAFSRSSLIHLQCINQKHDLSKVRKVLHL